VGLIPAHTPTTMLPSSSILRLSMEVKAEEPEDTPKEEADCAAQVSTEELHETPDNAKKLLVEEVSEESTEFRDDDDNEPVMEKAEAKIPREATQTPVDKIPALKTQRNREHIPFLFCLICITFYFF
jgi:hypothetical protein